MSNTRKEFLLYLESWPDSSLESLVLIYKGESKDVDLSKYPDDKIRKFIVLVEKLRTMRRHDDLQEIYEVIDNICREV